MTTDATTSTAPASAPPAAPPATNPTTPAAPAAPKEPSKQAEPAALDLPPEGEPATQKADVPAVEGDVDFKVPEGFQLDEGTAKEWKAAFKEQGLDSKKAQALVDRYAALEAKRVQADEQAFAEQDAKWVNEVKTAPDLGDAGVAAARRALSRLEGGREVANLITRAGLGNHPAVVRLFAALGRTMQEDSVAGATGSTGGAGPEKALHELLYPTMK